MRYNIVITDNETGEVLKEANADAIVASIHAKEATDVLEVTHCNGRAFAEMTAGLMGALKEIKKAHPLIYRLAKKFNKTGKKEITANE